MNPRHPTLVTVLDDMDKSNTLESLSTDKIPSLLFVDCLGRRCSLEWRKKQPYHKEVAIGSVSYNSRSVSFKSVRTRIHCRWFIFSCHGRRCSIEWGKKQSYRKEVAIGSVSYKIKTCILRECKNSDTLQMIHIQLSWKKVFCWMKKEAILPTKK